MSHDPNRFYHCDCLEGGYTAPCECKAIIAKLRTALEDLVQTLDQYWNLAPAANESRARARAVLEETK